MTREQIIKNLEYLIQFLPGKSIYAEKTLTCAIAALRDAMKRQEGCDYCNDTNEQKPLYYANKYEPYESMVSVIEISGAWNGIKPMIEVDLWDGANVSAVFEINYCPMCGRQLSGNTEQGEGGE